MPKPMNSALLGLEPSAIRRFTALAKETPGCLLLTLGEPEADTPRPVREAAAASLLEGDTHYPPNNGQPWLREGISRFAVVRPAAQIAELTDVMVITSFNGQGVQADE